MPVLHHSRVHHTGSILGYVRFWAAGRGGSDAQHPVLAFQGEIELTRMSMVGASIAPTTLSVGAVRRCCALLFVGFTSRAGGPALAGYCAPKMSTMAYAGPERAPLSFRGCVPAPDGSRCVRAAVAWLYDAVWCHSGSNAACVDA